MVARSVRDPRTVEELRKSINKTNQLLWRPILVSAGRGPEFTPSKKKLQRQQGDLYLKLTTSNPAMKKGQPHSVTHSLRQSFDNLETKPTKDENDDTKQNWMKTTQQQAKNHVEMN
jgi:hypothetical protein